MIRIATYLFVGAMAALTFATRQSIADVQFDLTLLADSGGYYVYSYELINPMASVGGVTAAAMSVSASSGAPAPLAATGGPFRDWTAGLATPLPRAEVGPIIPTDWYAALRATAELSWYLPVTDVSPDSLSPGDTLSGFGVRSSYLPGLRVMSFDPTVEACCTQPVDTTEERLLAFPEDHAIAGVSVGPRYKPEEVTIGLLQEQLDAVCDDPLWIDDAPLCTELTDSLEVIADRLSINNYWGSEATLFSTRNTLWNEQVPGGAVEWNAQWLLRTNLLQLFDNWPSYQQSNVRLCASAESETEGYFTVTSTGPEQLVPATVTIDAESGMDAPGSSCQMLWLMPSAGTDPVTVKIKLDSVSAGSELEEFGYDGYSGTPIVGPDSIVTTHDGNTTAYVHFIFVDN